MNYISHSSMSMFWRCGISFYFRYILNKIYPPNIAMLTGSATHKGAEITNRSRLDTDEDAPLDVVKDATRDEFVHRINDEGIWLLNEEKSEKKRLLNDGLNNSIAFATSYLKKYSHTHKKIHTVEEKLKADIGLDLPIIGIPDLIADDINEDLKVTGKRMSDGEEHLSHQPTFYKILARENELADMQKYKSSFVIMTKYKSAPRTQPYIWDSENSIAIDYRLTDRTEADELRLKNRLSIMIEMIKAGIFLPAEQNHWICCPERCGYYYYCKYSRR